MIVKKNTLVGQLKFDNWLFTNTLSGGANVVLGGGAARWGPTSGVPIGWLGYGPARSLEFVGADSGGARFSLIWSVCCLFVRGGVGVGGGLVDDSLRRFSWCRLVSRPDAMPRSDMAPLYGDLWSRFWPWVVWSCTSRPGPA